jgi:hypothetical protein
MSDTKGNIHQVEALEEEHRPSADIPLRGEDNEKDLSLWAAIRRYPRVMAYSFAATLGILLVRILIGKRATRSTW